MKVSILNVQWTTEHTNSLRSQYYGTFHTHAGKAMSIHVYRKGKGKLCSKLHLLFY